MVVLTSDGSLGRHSLLLLLLLLLLLRRRWWRLILLRQHELRVVDVAVPVPVVLVDDGVDQLEQLLVGEHLLFGHRVARLVVGLVWMAGGGQVGGVRRVEGGGGGYRRWGARSHGHTSQQTDKTKHTPPPSTREPDRPTDRPLTYQ